MSEIYVKENESLDNALKRFKRSCAKAGVMSDLRRKEYYQSPSVRRRKKSEAARKNKNKRYSYCKQKILHPRMQDFSLLFQPCCSYTGRSTYVGACASAGISTSTASVMRSLSVEVLMHGWQQRYVSSSRSRSMSRRTRWS